MPEEDTSEGQPSAVVVVLTPDDLSAYVDGEISGDVARDVEDLVEEDPRVARWLAAYQHQVACMHKAFGFGADSIPSSMTAMLRDAVEA